MPVVMTVGTPRRARSYRDWAAWRAACAPAGPATPLPRICAMCWGAGRFLTPARNGEGLIPCRCATCDGRGHAPALPAGA